ncbi:probable serine/threonine-protein kinase PBL2 [Carya illinoinensis]|uniref:probable serine/threonine-protein kinase PBL2 n=1 Tax=Carya illinoinensis TaxID=32201 RepID=UPI001C729980|nr:probable serine/threonine-protein kinase PBL2 [Carya illinoinensis]
MGDTPKFLSRARERVAFTRPPPSRHMRARLVRVLQASSTSGVRVARVCAWRHVEREFQSSSTSRWASGAWIDFNPKLSDFGLARYGPQDEQSHISSRVLGTRGYFAPEYFAKGHLTLKTDIYSFGVVLLEIISGYGAIENHSDGTVGDLVEWAKPYLRNKQCIIDKRLGNNFPREGAQKYAKIILRCLNFDPKGRPTMSEVVADLERLVQNAGSCNQSKLTTSIFPTVNFGNGLILDWPSSGEKR